MTTTLKTIAYKRSKAVQHAIEAGMPALRIVALQAGRLETSLAGRGLSPAALTGIIQTVFAPVVQAIYAEMIEPQLLAAIRAGDNAELAERGRIAAIEAFENAEFDELEDALVGVLADFDFAEFEAAAQ